MKTAEVRDIYSIDDLIDSSKKMALAQNGFSALRRAGLIKKPTLNFTDNEGYQCTPVSDVDKSVTLPLALIGFAIENPKDTYWSRFFLRAIETLKKSGMLSSQTDEEQTSTHTGLLVNSVETLTYITPRGGPTPAHLRNVLAARVRTIISAAQAEAAKQRTIIIPAPVANPVSLKKKPKIYDALAHVPEFKDGALEKTVKTWADFFSELYGKVIDIDDLTFCGDVEKLTAELFMKPAKPIVRVDQKHHDREYLGHLLSRAQSFGVEIILDKQIPYDSIRYPTAQFKDHTPGSNPITRSGHLLYYNDDRRKELVRPDIMKDETPCISFIRGHEATPPGFIQYTAIEELASLDDIVSAFVFSGWARKNDPALGQSYLNVMPLDARMHTANCTNFGRAITAKRTSQTVLRISDFLPTERLLHGVKKV